MPFIPVCGKVELAKRLGQAFGITQPWSRLVIEVDVGKPIMVYVKAPVDVRVVEKVTEIFETVQVEDVTVDDDSTVHVARVVPGVEAFNRSAELVEGVDYELATDTPTIREGKE